MMQIKHYVEGTWYLPIVVIVVVALLATAGLAASADATTDPGWEVIVQADEEATSDGITVSTEDVQVTQGESARVEFAVTNNRNNATTVGLQLRNWPDLPDGWEIDSFDAADGRWFESDRFWEGDVGAGETQTPAVVISISDEAEVTDHDIGGELLGEDIQVNSTISVTGNDTSDGPKARFDWDPFFPSPGETVVFNASNSFDPNGQIVSYDWTIDAGGPNERSLSGETVTTSFARNDDIEVLLNVTDDDGNWMRGSGTVQVGTGSNNTDGTIERIGFDYVNQGGSVNLEVNQDREYNESSFATLDGTTLGGVSVNVKTVGSSTPERGHVELSGPIETFAVGGQETSVDNIEFGPRSNPIENVTFDSISPNQSQYRVGDSPTVDGVPAQIIDFTFTNGTVYQKGAGSLNTGPTQPPNGSAPSFFQGNTNLWFNLSSVVNGTDDTLTPIGDFENPPTDPDGDGKFEDVNGDGNVNVGDAQAIFANTQDPVVQNNVAAFDFNGDGDVNVGDAQALFARGVGV